MGITAFTSHYASRGARHGRGGDLGKDYRVDLRDAVPLWLCEPPLGGWRQREMGLQSRDAVRSVRTTAREAVPGRRDGEWQDDPEQAVLAPPDARGGLVVLQKTGLRKAF